jgi:hypothetical protein
MRCLEGTEEHLARLVKPVRAGVPFSHKLIHEAEACFGCLSAQFLDIQRQIEERGKVRQAAQKWSTTLLPVEADFRSPHSLNLRA